MDGIEIDTLANRRSRSWSHAALAGRLAWALCRPAFRLSPRPLWGWRNLMLRAFGARVGAGVRVAPSVRIAVPWRLVLGDRVGVGERAILYSLGPITIGADATVSQGAHLCAGTHDHRHPAMPLLRPPISIGAGAWICADAFVGPGVSVGDMAVVGARAVAVRNVPAATVVAGNPARPVAVRTLEAGS
ncbi:LbetaH domain-containing protein [Acuticoccus mangrovi]|uniref:Acetyltransferase n=1 Tax=Acuticoccus mangrovi TaxID=2796142 RepID=A0A934ILC0_9HYPH|nr:acetyltransferase [Acuticoccus mangrovi]MBJ3775922.1 acetyltransferase [Acuticoccus mangrovi]